MQTHGIGLPELIIVLVLAILLFGGGKLGWRSGICFAADLARHLIRSQATTLKS